ncbi:MAG: hypothetical protein ACR2I8_08940 [Steroidobacteraceae bacterium]
MKTKNLRLPVAALVAAIASSACSGEMGGDATGSAAGTIAPAKRSISSAAVQNAPAARPAGTNYRAAAAVAAKGSVDTSAADAADAAAAASGGPRNGDTGVDRNKW